MIFHHRRMTLAGCRLISELKLHDQASTWHLKELNSSNCTELRPTGSGLHDGDLHLAREGAEGTTGREGQVDVRGDTTSWVCQTRHLRNRLRRAHRGDPRACCSPCKPLESSECHILQDKFGKRFEHCIDVVNLEEMPITGSSESNVHHHPLYLLCAAVIC